MIKSSPLTTSLVMAPEGIHYIPDFITEDEECRLIEAIGELEFSEVRMHGIAAKRRVAHFGLVYGYETWRVEPGPPVPEFLFPLQARVAGLLKTALRPCRDPAHAIPAWRRHRLAPGRADVWS